jgi:hypothetical protein
MSEWCGKPSRLSTVSNIQQMNLSKHLFIANEAMMCLLEIVAVARGTLAKHFQPHLQWIQVLKQLSSWN